MVLPVVAAAASRAAASVVARQVGKELAKDAAIKVAEKAIEGEVAGAATSAFETAEVSQANQARKQAQNAISKYSQNAPKTTTQANATQINKRRPSDGGDLIRNSGSNLQAKTQANDQIQKASQNPLALSEETKATLDTNTQRLLENPVKAPEKINEVGVYQEQPRNYYDEFQDAVENNSLVNEYNLSSEIQDTSSSNQSGADNKKFPTGLFIFTLVEYVLRVFFVISGITIFILGTVLASSSAIPVLGWALSPLLIPLGSTFLAIGSVCFGIAKVQGIVANIIVNFFLVGVDVSALVNSNKAKEKMMSFLGRKVSLKVGMSIINTIPVLGDLFPSLPVLVWKNSK